MTSRNIQVTESVMMKKAYLLMAAWQIRIKQEMQAKQITQERLAEMIGVTQGALSHWFSGRRNIDFDKLLQIADSLGIPHSELLSEDLIPQHKKKETQNVQSTDWSPFKNGRVPLISWVNAGDFCEAEAIDLAQIHVEEWLPLPVGAGPNTYCLKVDGWSMYNPGGERSYRPGTIIYVDPDVPVEIGKRVIARNGSECTFKELTEDSGRKFLRPLNPQFSALEVTETTCFCGVVIGSYVKE